MADPSYSQTPRSEGQISKPSADKAQVRPFREKAVGRVKGCDHNLNILRSCQACGACFLCLAFGKTGEVGRWRSWAWFCSTECAPPLTPAKPTTEGTP